ncbi:hypothetical protein HMSSN036_80870 [Paenibacillus macerans]|nr:hypothetical protein HMSSN036_80870 [Paenibacillus macerans]
MFEYIKAAQQSDQPLALTGFDMQLQYPLLDGGWLQDQTLAERLANTEQRLSDYANGTDLKGYQEDKSAIIQVYNDILKDVESAKTQAALKERYPDNAKLPVLLERGLNERIRFANEYAEISIRANLGMQTGDYAPFFESMEWRDKTMLDNLMWLVTEVYPTEKFIVWGHNDHIRKAHSEVMGTPYPVKLMGELLPDEMKNTAIPLVCIQPAAKRRTTPKPYTTCFRWSPVRSSRSCPRPRRRIRSSICATKAESAGTPGCSNRGLLTAGASSRKAWSPAINTTAFC